VEKDFACLDGSDEDNRDTFTNSMESRVYELPPIHDLKKWQKRRHGRGRAISLTGRFNPDQAAFV
jgi:hypothetical protein